MGDACLLLGKGILHETIDNPMFLRNNKGIIRLRQEVRLRPPALAAGAPEKRAPPPSDIKNQKGDDCLCILIFPSPPWPSFM